MAVYDVNGTPVCGLEPYTHTDAECSAAFLTYMAEKCTELGMSGTHFENPNGLTSESYSTPQDMLKLGLAVSASTAALGVWSTTDRSFNIKGSNGRTLSVGNNVISTYAATLAASGYKLLGGKGGSLSSSYGYKRACVLLADVQNVPVLLSILTTGQTAYNNIDKSARELCDMIAAKINGQTPTPGTNLNALVTAGGGYAACVVPNVPGGYIHLESPAELIARTTSVSASPTASLLPASTTKIMTMICALDYVTNLSENLTVKTVDIESGSGSTFYDGDELRVFDALKIMMMESSNTLANAIARTVGNIILNHE